MINKSSMRMIDENNNKKMKNECWNEKTEMRCFSSLSHSQLFYVR